LTALAFGSGLVRIGTRRSALALTQAGIVLSALVEWGIAAELVAFTTVGDRRLETPVHEIGGKGVFTAELEAALASGVIDCAVHSLKDLPTVSPPGLDIMAVLPREDPRDVLVLAPGLRASGVGDLPRGARVGTSSLRRRALLAARRPDLEHVDLRGNVPTRLRKVADGQVHAAVLAAAGLLRLDEADCIGAYLDAIEWLPAAGQGAIAIQARADDVKARRALGQLNDAETTTAVTAERAMLAGLEGGCHVPIGALAVRGRSGGDLVLHGLIAEVSGARVLRGQHVVDPGSPAAGGAALARHLHALGAGDILEAVRP
jgi:hydroxymethylbilane synthase